MPGIFFQADHMRLFTSNHIRPMAAMINTAATDHGVDEVGSSLGGDGAVEGAFLGADRGTLCRAYAFGSVRFVAVSVSVPAFDTTK